MTWLHDASMLYTQGLSQPPVCLDAPRFSLATFAESQLTLRLT